MHTNRFILVPAALFKGVDYRVVSAWKSKPMELRNLSVSILQFKAAQWAAVKPYSRLKSNR